MTNEPCRGHAAASDEHERHNRYVEAINDANGFVEKAADNVIALVEEEMLAVYDSAFKQFGLHNLDLKQRLADAEDTIARLSSLHSNYETRARYAPKPMAQWSDIAGDLQEALRARCPVPGCERGELHDFVTFDGVNGLRHLSDKEKP